jgi:hypothetical protein
MAARPDDHAHLQTSRWQRSSIRPNSVGGRMRRIITGWLFSRRVSEGRSVQKDARSNHQSTHECIAILTIAEVMRRVQCRYLRVHCCQLHKWRLALRLQGL